MVGISVADKRVNFFHAVGDAVELDVADLVFEYIVDNMSFGQYSSTTTDLPANVRSLFFTSTDSIITIASRSIDLAALEGNTITIFLSGFIVPDDNNFGPVLGFFAVDTAGQVIELSLVLSTPINELLSDLKMYPNPATDYVRLDFSSELYGSIDLYLTDLSGKQYLHHSHQVSIGFNSLQLSIPAIPSGLYLLQLTNGLTQTSLPLVILR